MKLIALHGDSGRRTLLNPFEYHKPEGEAIERIERLRAAYWQLYQVLDAETRPGGISGRYAALARTELEASAMWATKSVVFEGDNPEPAPGPGPPATPPHAGARPAARLSPPRFPRKETPHGPSDPGPGRTAQPPLPAKAPDR